MILFPANISMEMSSTYNVTKAGLSHFARTVALEGAAKGIRVNSLNPGFVDTEISIQGEERDASKVLSLL